MTATFAFSLIAFLLMLGVVADSLWGQRFWRRPCEKVGLGASGPGPKGVGSEEQHYSAAQHRAGE